MAETGRIPSGDPCAAWLLFLLCPSGPLCGRDRRGNRGEGRAGYWLYGRYRVWGRRDQREICCAPPFRDLYDTAGEGSQCEPVSDSEISGASPECPGSRLVSDCPDTVAG